MATIIKIKRSSTTNVPNLGQGELGYSWGSATYTDAQNATVASYGKMYLGTGTETGGIAANIEVIGGKYFTDMLDHGHGTLTANSAVLVDSASKIDIWNVDNLRLDGNTISSTNTDGDINLDPNGTGEIVVPDDTYLTFGTSRDTRIKYDELTDDRLEVTGADWNFADGVAINISDTTTSTSPTTGALTVTGGVGISGNLNVAGSITAGSLATPANFTVSGDLTVQGGDINITEVATNFNIKDNTASALAVKEGTNTYLDITTTDNAELITLGNSITSVDVVVEDNVSSAFEIKEGANTYLNIDTTNNSELISLGNSISSTHIAVEDNAANAFKVGQGADNYINVATTDGAEILTLGNNLSTINAVIEDNTSSAFTLKESTNTYLQVDTTDNSELITIGNSITSTNILLEDNAAAALLVKEGTNNYIKLDTTNGSELITFSTANLDIDTNLNIDGANLTTNLTTTPFNLLNTNVQNINFGGAATNIEIGSSTGTTNINNNLDVDGDVNIDGNDLTTSLTTTPFNLLNTNVQTINFAGAASTVNIGTSSTIVDFGSLRIQGTTIYSESGAETITIDPFPAGGDADGDVVIRGNLQVTGTTVTVNSTVMTVNDPVFTIGDSISLKVVVSAATNGATTLVLDNVTGLNVGDILSGVAEIPGNTTITVIDAGTNTITISAAITAGIAAGTDVTFTQGADDNMDRGIEFRYYRGGLKTGFFGYDEAGIAEDVTTYYFTYIPDATNTSNTFSGTVGSAYFKTVKIDDGVTNGIPFFDAYKRITTTVAAGTNDATTSNQILTVNGSGVPVWTTTLDGGTY